jgi:hypothetical protein
MSFFEFFDFRTFFSKTMIHPYSSFVLSFFRSSSFYCIAIILLIGILCGNGKIVAQTSFSNENISLRLRANDWWYCGFGRGSEMVTLQDIKKIKDEKPVKQKLLDIGFGEKTKDKLQKKDIEFEGFENSSIIRIVMYDKESKTVLANMAYRKISDEPLRFVPDTKVSQDSQAKYSIQVVDSTKYESLKWATIMGYYSALQMLQHTPAGKQAIDEMKKKQNPKTAETLQLGFNKQVQQ